MNNQEAKLILQAYRTNGEDAPDPMFAEALEQARRDPELQKWFAQENALNTRIQTRLESAIPVPRGLKSELLALRKTVRPDPWWFQPMKLAAMAAALLVLAGLYFMLPRKPAELVSFRETMARRSARMQDHVSFPSHDLAQIQQWLQGQNLQTNFDLPALLQAGTVQGCRVMNWHGHKATMICFMLNGEHLDLFVMERTGLPEFPDNNTPQFAKAGGLMTAMWANGEKVYLLTAKNKEVLQKVLQPT